MTICKQTHRLVALILAMCSDKQSAQCAYCFPEDTFIGFWPKEAGACSSTTPPSPGTPTVSYASMRIASLHMVRRLWVAAVMCHWPVSFIYCRRSFIYLFFLVASSDILRYTNYTIKYPKSWHMKRCIVSSRLN